MCSAFIVLVEQQMQLVWWTNGSALCKIATASINPFSSGLPSLSRAADRWHDCTRNAKCFVDSVERSHGTVCDGWRDFEQRVDQTTSRLSSFHARIDAVFEEMRVFPGAAARRKTVDSRSLTPEHDLPLVSAHVGASGSTVVNGARNSSSRPERAHELAYRPGQR